MARARELMGVQIAEDTTAVGCARGACTGSPVRATKASSEAAERFPAVRYLVCGWHDSIRAGNLPSKDAVSMDSEYWQGQGYSGSGGPAAYALASVYTGFHA